MIHTTAHIDHMAAVTECGRICAIAGEAQRDLRACTELYPDLFSSKPFDPALFSTVALANTFSAPWLTVDRLRIANRASLWIFALDWLIDYVAQSRDDVADLTQACLKVADGAPPRTNDSLTHFLADLLDELTSASAFETLRPMWRHELQRTLGAMAREWDWKSVRAQSSEVASPSFEEYLANADNSGFCFVYASHWAYTGDVQSGEHTNELILAARQVQRTLRLVNDLATYDRDVRWGDLNALMLGKTVVDLRQQTAELLAGCREQLGELRTRHPQLTYYLERQLGFNMGFYAITDYWGSL